MNGKLDEINPSILSNALIITIYTFRALTHFLDVNLIWEEKKSLRAKLGDLSGQSNWVITMILVCGGGGCMFKSSETLK